MHGAWCNHFEYDVLMEFRRKVFQNSSPISRLQNWFSRESSVGNDSFAFWTLVWLRCLKRQLLFSPSLSDIILALIFVWNSGSIELDHELFGWHNVQCNHSWFLSKVTGPLAVSHWNTSCSISQSLMDLLISTGGSDLTNGVWDPFTKVHLAFS